MSLEARLRELTLRHKRLEDTIDSEKKHPSVSDHELTSLKRKKLRIKDEIEQLKTH